MDSSGAQSQSFLIPVLLPIPSWVRQALSPLAWATSGITSGEAAAGRKGPSSGLIHPVLRAQRQGQRGSWRARGLAEALLAATRPQDILCYLWASGLSVLFVMSPPPGLQVGLSPLAGFLHHFSTEAPLPCPPASSGLASLESPWAEG